jgi:hypothetical protein
MSHSVFGWSYPPGCSGPPDDPPEKSCTCGHSEIEHDFQDESDRLGACLHVNCDCECFTEATNA